MKKVKSIKSDSTIKARFWTRVFVVGIIFSITFFLIFLDASREYRATIDVLVASKGENFSVQAGDITGNIVEFPKMLSFYEKMLVSNPEIKDAFEGKGKDEKKKLWNKIIESSLKESRGNSIINISVFSKSSAEAEVLLRAVSKSLAEVVSEHYDPVNEISIEIVDGPIISVVSRTLAYSAMIAIVCGSILSLVLNYFLEMFDRILISYKSNVSRFSRISFEKKDEGSQESENLFVSEEYPYDVPYDFGSLGKEEHLLREEEKRNLFKSNPYPNYPEMPKIEAKKAEAPENLPVAEAFEEYEEAAFEEEKPSEIHQPTFVEMKQEEPTDEELRERLNKLLRGEI